MTKKERMVFVTGLPWVTKLKVPIDRCEGIRWSTVAMKDIYPSGPRADQVPARGFQDRSLCKNKGWYKFKALRPRGAFAYEAKSGTYCWSHLMTQIYSTPQEESRFNKSLESRSYEPASGDV